MNNPINKKLKTNNSCNSGINYDNARIEAIATNKYIKFALLNVDILMKIFTYCTVPDLTINLRFVSKIFRSCSKSVLHEILQIVIHKYYSKTYMDSCISLVQLQSLTKLDLLHLLSTQFILIIRGFVTYKLELKTNKWTRCPDTRRDRGHFAIAYLKGYVYAIGTLNLIATGTVERYNLLTNNWMNVASLPNHLQSVAAVVYKGDKMYVIGGVDATTNMASNAIFEYDDEIDKWTVLAHTIHRSRSRHSVAEFNGKIWVVGGRLQDEPATCSVELYDPSTGICEDGPPLTRHRLFGNLLIVQDDLYAIGGDVDDSGQQLLVIRTIEKYNQNANIWEYVTTFKDQRKGFSTCAVGNKIYVFGGSDLSESYNDTWDVYDVQLGIWESSKLSSYHKMPQIDDWGQSIAIPHYKVTW